MSKNLDGISIDGTHSMAICTEIGERLQLALPQNTALPTKLAALLARLDELDVHQSPSIIPTLEVLEPD